MRSDVLSLASAAFGLPTGYGESLRSDMRSVARGLSSYWMKMGVGMTAGLVTGAVTAGIAAPFIGSLIGGALGVTGAAATHAGLAIIAGGAKALGGLGAAGGHVFLTGSGALLGLGLGSGASSLSKELTPGAAVLAVAKIEVFLRRVVIERNHDLELFREVADRLAEVVDNLAEALPEIRLAEDAKPSEIRERERALAVLKKGLARIQSISVD